MGRAEGRPLEALFCCIVSYITTARALQGGLGDVRVSHERHFKPGGMQRRQARAQAARRLPGIASKDAVFGCALDGAVQLVRDGTLAHPGGDCLDEHLGPYIGRCDALRCRLSWGRCGTEASSAGGFRRRGGTLHKYMPDLRGPLGCVDFFLSISSVSCMAHCQVLDLSSWCQVSTICTEYRCITIPAVRAAAWVETIASEKIRVEGGTGSTDSSASGGEIRATHTSPARHRGELRKSPRRKKKKVERKPPPPIPRYGMADMTGLGWTEINGWTVVSSAGEGTKKRRETIHARRVLVCRGIVSSSVVRRRGKVVKRGCPPS